MFEVGINVGDYLKRIRRLIDIGRKIKEINHNAKAVKKFAMYIKSKHGVYITPKLSVLDSIINGLSLIEKSQDIEIIREEFNTVELLFNEFFNESVVYLARHPEKTKEKGRSLSNNGVRQAVNFAKFITEMILFCPKKVNLKLNYSDVRRTFLVARTVQMKINQISRKNKKAVNIIEMIDHPALFFRFLDQAVNTYVAEKKAGKDEFVIFDNWINNKYQGFPDHKKVSNEVLGWAKENLFSVNLEEWTITIGISHSFILDTFLWYNTGGNISSIIGTLEFAKLYPTQFYYREKWYKF